MLSQVWHDLLFAHWPVPAAALRPLIPRRLTLEEFDGSAWVAVTPFWMSRVGFRDCPRLPGAARFEELNVRTYVTLGERPGVWFFSLDAASRLAVWGARRLYHLPYTHARMRHESSGEEIHYHSERRDGTGFTAHYAASGPVGRSQPGTLEHWLTERYCLYAQDGAGRLYRAEIQHEPWPLQRAMAQIERNDMLLANRVPACGLPAQLHFSRRLEVVVWPLEEVRVTA